MSGHSKWSTIKRQKAVTDARKAAVFTKLAKAITLAAREGGTDPETNFRLRLAMQKGRDANMPNDNIDRAIKRGAGEGEGVELSEVLYEAYGPGGIGILIEGVTDNKNRTAAEMKHLLTRSGGSLATANSVAWQFDQKGVVRISKDALQRIDDTEAFQLKLIDAGAEDVEDETEGWTITTPKESFSNIMDVIAERSMTPESQGLEYIPQNLVPTENKKSIETIIGQLEEHDDVTSVYTNANI